MAHPRFPKHQRGTRPPYTGHRPSQINTTDYLVDPLHLAHRRTPELKKFSLFDHKLIDKFADWQERETTYTADIEPYESVIYNQFQTATCVCNAAAAAYKYALDRREQRHCKFVPSRLFLYYVVRAMYAQFKNVASAEIYEKEKEWLGSLLREGRAPTADILADEGCDIASVCRILCYLEACDERPVSNGTAPVDTWPFYEVEQEDFYRSDAPARTLWGDVVNDWRTKGGVFVNENSLGAKAPPPGAFHQAVRHRTLDCASPPRDKGEDSLSNWKQCLENGYPIIVSFEAFEEYGGDDITRKKSITAPDYILTMPSSESKWMYTHVVLIVGYDYSKDGGCFRIQDSYGKDWVDGGLWWIPYRAMKTTILIGADPASRQPGLMLTGPWILENVYYNYGGVFEARGS